jgi:hypothetical protein
LFARLHAAAFWCAQVSVYAVETAAQPDTASAAGGDFAALLSTQSTEGAPLRKPPWSRIISFCTLPHQRNAASNGALASSCLGIIYTAWQ